MQDDAEVTERANLDASVEVTRQQPGSPASSPPGKGKPTHTGSAGKWYLAILVAMWAALMWFHFWNYPFGGPY